MCFFYVVGYSARFRLAWNLWRVILVERTVIFEITFFFFFFFK